MSVPPFDPYPTNLGAESAAFAVVAEEVGELLRDWGMPNWTVVLDGYTGRRGEVALLLRRAGEEYSYVVPLRRPDVLGFPISNPCRARVVETVEAVARELKRHD